MAIETAEEMLGGPLIEDCVDPATGEIHPLVIVTDNGPAYKSTDFLRFIRSHQELRHVRTRHHAPETNGVVERFNGSLKYEHLYREEITDAQALTEPVERFRQIYNRIRPHEAIGFLTPAVVHLSGPNLFQAESLTRDIDNGALNRVFASLARLLEARSFLFGLTRFRTRPAELTICEQRSRQYFACIQNLDSDEAALPIEIEIDHVASLQWIAGIRLGYPAGADLIEGKVCDIRVAIELPVHGLAAFRFLM